MRRVQKIIIGATIAFGAGIAALFMSDGQWLEGLAFIAVIGVWVLGLIDMYRSEQ